MSEIQPKVSYTIVLFHEKTIQQACQTEPLAIIVDTTGNWVEFYGLRKQVLFDNYCLSRQTCRKRKELMMLLWENSVGNTMHGAPSAQNSLLRAAKNNRSCFMLLTAAPGPVLATDTHRLNQIAGTIWKVPGDVFTEPLGLDNET